MSPRRLLAARVPRRMSSHRRGMRGYPRSHYHCHCYLGSATLLLSIGARRRLLYTSSPSPPHAWLPPRPSLHQLLLLSQ